MSRIVLDWLAPVFARRVLELSPSSFWPSSLCLFRPNALIEYADGTNWRCADSMAKFKRPQGVRAR